MRDFIRAAYLRSLSGNRQLSYDGNTLSILFFWPNGVKSGAITYDIESGSPAAVEYYFKNGEKA